MAVQNINKEALLCSECGHSMNSTRENVPYRSLPGVVLVNVEVFQCPSCGERQTAIPQIEALDRFLVSIIVKKRQRLSGNEIRFLRKFLGLSSVDLAERMGTQPETVSRWENGSQTMGTQTDRLLRLMSTYGEPVQDYLQLLADVAKEEPIKTQCRLIHENNDWELDAA